MQNEPTLLLKNQKVSLQRFWITSILLSSVILMIGMSTGGISQVR